ncbi:class I tRNA ligase family protein [Candidatus Gracilibacteria bacterium]|nr:class I tRNA ligase family protein [Candidatus Gracilibacteria bacterium]
MSEQEEVDFLAPSRLASYRLVYNFLFDSEQLTPQDNVIKTFTTRVDTLPGATFVIVSPEYNGLLDMVTPEYQLEVANYIEMAKNKSDRERQIGKEKSAVFTGRFVRHPLNNQLLPVWASDFVLGGYGTGAVMADAHDSRDCELALQYGIYINETVSEDGKPRENFLDKIKEGYVFEDYGVLFRSEKYNGLTSEQAKEVIADDLVAMGKAEKQVNYKFRDWVFSRQRYWGEPFPIEYVEKDDGEVEIRLLEDSELPLVLPDLEDFEPSKDGRSPLAKSDWTRVDERTTREADTMPNWAGSNWYYLRFCDPKNSQEFASQKNLDYWLPVDHYFGGGEHTTMHLLYSRFGHKFLYDQGLVPTMEPYDYRHNGGILLGSDGSKMSKSKGNVIIPDDKLETVGADALRLYVCFIGPYDATVTWIEGGLNRCKKLVDDIWVLREKVDDNKADKSLVVAYHKMLKKITGYLESQKNNVAVSELMSFVNILKEQTGINREIWQNFVLVLAPFAPHLAEELAIIEYLQHTQKSEADIDWETLNKEYGSIHKDPWPKYDESYTVDDEVTYAVQVNGKVRADFGINAEATEEEILTEAKAIVTKWLEGKDLKFHKIIPGKLVTLVVK